MPRTREICGRLLEDTWLLTSLARGLLWSRVLSQTAPQLRVERGTRIRNSTKVSVGRSCWLKESVIIDGRSDRVVGVVLGDNVTIRTGSYIDAYGNLGFVRLGDRVGIGQHVYIGGNGGVTIEDDVMISGHAYLVSATHRTNPDMKVPYREQGESRIGIVVRKNAWIAAGCIVLDGVEVGENSVIGAGSVVTRSVPSNVLALGSPARVIRDIETRRNMEPPLS